MTVEHDIDRYYPQNVGNGEVLVDGRRVAAPYGGIEYRVVARIRQRTPDWWWEWAATILASEDDIRPGTGGPLGYGVDFLLEEVAELFDADARSQIQVDAHEDARASILTGAVDYTRRLVRNLPAL